MWILTAPDSFKVSAGYVCPGVGRHRLAGGIASLPGRGAAIVAGDGEFRSNLFPWLALVARGYRVS